MSATPEEQLQKLVDISFQLVFTASNPHHWKLFRKMTMEQKAAWVRDQLAASGFPTEPCGASWGVLREHVWMEPSSKNPGIPFPYCDVCGMVKRRDEDTAPCKGPMKMRSMEKPL